MSDNTSIEWADASWNPIAAFDTATNKRGWLCVHVSEGCRFCYSERLNVRLGNGYLYEAQNLDKVRFDIVNLNQPLRWKRPRRIFVCSMTDLFADFVSDDILDQIFAVMALAPWHTFQCLTKRPARMADYVNEIYAGRVYDIAEWYLRKHHANDKETVRTQIAERIIGAFAAEAPQIWLGVSCEDQRSANERIPLLLETPAVVRWISAEPLLGPIDFRTGVYQLGHQSRGTSLDGISWMVAGAESGPGARPMDVAWARGIKNQCVAANVSFFFKQDARNGHKIPLPELDGKQWVEYPTTAHSSAVGVF